MHVVTRQCWCKQRQRASTKPWPPCLEEPWQKKIKPRWGVFVLSGVIELHTGAKYSISTATAKKKKKIITLTKLGWSSDKGDVFLQSRIVLATKRQHCGRTLLIVILDLLLRHLLIMYSYIGERHFSLTDLAFFFFPVTLFLLSARRFSLTQELNITCCTKDMYGRV